MEKLAGKIKDVICKNKPGLTIQQVETIKFGLECTLNEAFKIVVYFIIFALLSLTDHYLVALVFFCIARIFAGGYHTDTFLKCFIVSFLILSTGIFTGSQFVLPFTVRLVLLVISIILAWIFAPVDHPNKPIISMDRRKRFKYLSVVVFIILAGITFMFTEKLATTAVIILFLEAILLPIGQIVKRRNPYEYTED